MPGVAMGKKPGWVRNELPDEIKVTFVVNRRNEPLLHAYLSSLPFRSASAEVRRLLKSALIAEAGSIQPKLPRQVDEVAQSGNHQVETRPPAMPQPVSQQRSVMANGLRASQVSQADLDAISALDEMTG